jgi:large-conductance mechanosensitive channel
MLGAAGRMEAASVADVEDLPATPRAAGGARATERAGLLAGGAAAAQASYSAVAAGSSAAQDKAAGCASSWPRPVRAVACCCCWSTKGLAKLLTDPGTQQIAVAFVVGDQFGKLIYSLVNTVVSPILFALLFETRELGSARAYAGFVVLTNPNNAPALSVESAIAAGCRVLAWSAFLEEGFVFLATMLTLYWVTKALRPIGPIVKSRRGAPPTPPEQQQHQQHYTEVETATCEMCIRPIHPLARRCPHCTSPVAPQDQVQSSIKAFS